MNTMNIIAMRDISGHSGHNRHPGRCKEKDVGYIVLASFVIAIIVCFILCFC